MSRTHYYTLAALSLIPALLAPAACNKRKKRPTIKRPAQTVHVEAIRESTRSTNIIASGVAAPLREATLSTQVAGVLTAFEIQLGKTVKAGDLLARVTTAGLYGRAKSARAQIQQIRGDLAKAQRDYKNSKRLYEARVESRKAFEDSKFQTSRLKAQLSQARANLSQVGDSYRGGKVTAPFGGVISNKSVEQGDYVTPGRVLGRLVDLSEMVVTASVAEHDILSISAKTPTSVRFPAVGARRFPGRIRAISPTADKNTGAYAVEIVVTNVKSRIKGGMTARVTFLRPGEKGLFLPVEAVLKRKGKQVVFVLADDDKSVKQLEVNASAPRDGLVRLLNGFTPGTRVVISGQTRLHDGATVRLAKPSPGPISPTAAMAPRAKR